MNETSTQRVARAYAALESSNQPQAWIHVTPHEVAQAEAAQIDARAAQGERLPLAGMVIAVKDNIDVAGLPTTGASPGASYLPGQDATSVALLRAAGAVIIGKTNMDQFATGLVGTRSPYGIPVSILDDSLVSGGSSSGSAVAVALGIVDAALGTDTAGSGRVPAAFNKIVGLKPTLGVVSSAGLMPASPSYDTITVFARELGVAELVFAQIADGDSQDPRSRTWDASAPLAAPAAPVIGVPPASALETMSDAWRSAFEQTTEALRAAGHELVEVDVQPLLDAAKLLYGGALIAERTAAFGSLLESQPETVDPTVAAIVNGGYTKTAVELASNQFALARAKQVTAQMWAMVDALVLPTAPGHPSVQAVLDDPIAVNSWVGTYTNFVNLLDLAALAIPGIDPVGVTLIGPAFADRALLDLGRVVERAVLGVTGVGVGVGAAGASVSGAAGAGAAGAGAAGAGAAGAGAAGAGAAGAGAEVGVAWSGAAWSGAAWSGADVSSDETRWIPPSTTVAVFGAHLSGQPLNHQLTTRGARLVRTVTTAASYKLFALDTIPAKPGLVKVDHGGSAFVGEEWAIPDALVGQFFGDVMQPMCIGKVDLADGRQVMGFLCEPGALDGAQDISGFSGWAQFRESQTVTA